MNLRTSVDGFGDIWHAVLERFFSRHPRRGRDQRLRRHPRHRHPAPLPSTGGRTSTLTDTTPAVTIPDAFTELSARERARAVLDEGSFRELIGPFDRLESPHLAPQGIVPQSDDGAVVARGTIAGERAVVVSIDGKFQGGGEGEVNGAKLAGSLELAARDWEQGRPIRPVLLLETGGIRLQEANLGLLAIADIHAAIVRLRQHTPVVGVIAGAWAASEAWASPPGCARTS